MRVLNFIRCMHCLPNIKIKPPCPWPNYTWFQSILKLCMKTLYRPLLFLFSNCMDLFDTISNANSTLLIHKNIILKKNIWFNLWFIVYPLILWHLFGISRDSNYLKPRNDGSWCYKGFLRCHPAVTMYFSWRKEKTNTLFKMNCPPSAPHYI